MVLLPYSLPVHHDAAHAAPLLELGLHARGVPQTRSHAAIDYLGLEPGVEHFGPRASLYARGSLAEKPPRPTPTHRFAATLVRQPEAVPSLPLLAQTFSMPH